MQQLPTDTIGEILQHLDPTSSIRFSRSCKRFYNLCDDVFWKSKFITEYGDYTTNYRQFYQGYNYLYAISREGKVSKILDKTIVAYSRNGDEITLMDAVRNLYLYRQGRIHPVDSKRPITQDLLLFDNYIRYVSDENIVTQTPGSYRNEQRADGYEVRDMFAGPNYSYYWLLSKNTGKSLLISSRNEAIFHGSCRRLVVLRSRHFYYMLYIDDDGILHTMEMTERKIKGHGGKKFVDLWLSANQNFAFLKDTVGNLLYVGTYLYTLDYLGLEKVVKTIKFGDCADHLTIRIFNSQFVNFKINRLAIWKTSYKDQYHPNNYHQNDENREYVRGRIYYYRGGYSCYDVYKYYYIDEEHNLWTHIYADRQKIAGYKFTDIIGINDRTVFCLGTKL